MSRTIRLLTTLTALILAVGLFQWPPSVLPSSQARDPSSPPAATETNIPPSVELHQGLGSLPYLNRARSRSVCAENPTGAKAKGGMAVPNPPDPSPPASARAADDLGQGWKVRPFLRVNKGQTATLMDVDGPGVIEHIWMVEGLSRANVLRFYWDSEPTPSIEVPAPDFFAVGHGKFAQVSSLAVVVNPNLRSTELDHMSVYLEVGPLAAVRRVVCLRTMRKSGRVRVLPEVRSAISTKLIQLEKEPIG